MNRRRIKVSFGGCLITFGVLLVLAAGVAFAVTRPGTPPDAVAAAVSPAAPTPPTSTGTAPASPSVAPAAPDHTAEAATLARKYVTAYKAGRTAGGELWLAQLRPLASPALVKAVAQTDPDIIPTSDTKATTVESMAPDGTGLVRVTFRDGSWLLLHTQPAPVAGLWVVAVEGSKVTATP